MDLKTIKSRLDRARADRQRLEPMFDDAMRLTMPGRKRFTRNDIDDGSDVMDETGANAVSEFVSRISAGVTPPFQPFLRLQASSLVDEADRKAVNLDLDAITEYAFEQIWQSNFSQELNEAHFDMAVSTGTLLVEEGDNGTVLKHRAVPMPEMFFERGGDGSIRGKFHRAEVPASEIEQTYPNAKISPDLLRKLQNENDRPVNVISYMRTEPGRTPVSHHVVMIEEHDAIIQERSFSGTGADPFITYRWATNAGSAWGRGPLMNALAAVRTTNLMVELVLENAAMAIVGVYQTDNDATINAETVNLLPGTILPKEIGTKGLEAVNMAAGNFNMRDVVLNDQRTNIKRALFNDMLSDPNKTPATAYEVSERMADLAYRSAAGFSRIFYEMVCPYFWRALHILVKRGDIQLPTKNKHAIHFHAISPLAQAQFGRDLQALMSQHQMNMALFGQQGATAALDIAKVLPWMQARSGLPEDLFKKPADVIAAVQQAAQMMAQTMQAQQAPGGAQ